MRKETFRFYRRLLCTVLLVANCSPVTVEMPDDTAYSEAYDLYRLDQYRAAADAFESFVQEYPYSEKVDNSTYYVGKCYRKLGDLHADSSYSAGSAQEQSELVQTAVSMYQEARHWFSSIDKRSTRYVWGQFFLCETGASMAVLDSLTFPVNAAASELTDFCQRYPSHSYRARALLALAQMYSSVAEFEMAADYYNQLISDASFAEYHSVAYYRGGKSAYENNSCDVAIPWLNSFLQLEGQKEISDQDSVKIRNANFYLTNCQSSTGL